MVDLKEMDERGKMRIRIHTLVTTLSIEDVRDTVDFMELRHEVMEANVRDIKGEHEERGENNGF